jgi:heat shock protein HslJ
MKKTIITFSVVLIMVLLTGCKCASKASASKESITSTGWEVSAIEGKEILKADYPRGLPDAVFSSDNKISGSSGCNRYGGSYTLDAEGKFSTSELISTKMFCQGVKEDAYLKAVSSANRAKIEGSNLVLYNETTPVLVFVPKKLK